MKRRAPSRLDLKSKHIGLRGGSGLHPRLEVDEHMARLVLEALRRVEDVRLQRDVVPQDERREDHLHLHDHQASRSREVSE